MLGAHRQKSTHWEKRIGQHEFSQDTYNEGFPTSRENKTFLLITADGKRRKAIVVPSSEQNPTLELQWETVDEEKQALSAKSVAAWCEIQ